MELNKKKEHLCEAPTFKKYILLVRLNDILKHSVLVLRWQSILDTVNRSYRMFYTQFTGMLVKLVSELLIGAIQLVV